MTAEIVLMGEGHGAHAALAGIGRSFGHIDLVTSDSQLIATGHNVVPDLASSDAPLVVLAGCREILELRTIARRPVFNIHPSLLPEYRGRHSVVWAMLGDEPKAGITIHLVDEEMDNGPILHQHAETIGGADTSRILFERLNGHIAEHLGRVLREYLAGERTLRPQDHSRATWYPRRGRDDCLIDFHRDHGFLDRLFRALVEPYPLPAIVCRRGRFEVTAHRLIARVHHAPPGRVVNRTSEGEVFVTTQGGLLAMRRLRDSEGADYPATAILRLNEVLG
jgi:methionyl-tRNA formyltransferase